MIIKHRSYTLIMCLPLVAIILGSCSDAGITNPPGISCKPGDNLSCTCSGGSTGIKTCVSDGSHWGACECNNQPTQDVISDIHEDGPDSTAIADTGDVPPTDTESLQEVHPDDISPQDLCGTEGFDCGLPPHCPLACILPTPNSLELPPLSTLYLDGACSAMQGGTIESYQWSMTAPTDDVTHLNPDETAAYVTAQLNLVGSYSFSLDAFDNNGVKSCSPAQHSVTTAPTQCLYVQLTWKTSGDSDEGDECPAAVSTGEWCGTDMDLHLRHPSAPNYFNMYYDCSWQNPAPEWGNAALSSDNPAVLRTDLDGGGPEVIAIEVCEPQIPYQIGVHYWSDHDFGSATARLRVFINGAPVNEWTRKLTDHQLWDVATVTSDGTVVVIDEVTKTSIGD